MSEDIPVIEVEETKTEEAKTNDIPAEPATQPVAPTEPVRMKKPHYGGRKKDPNTVDRYSRTTCPDRNKSLSIHGLKNIHIDVQLRKKYLELSKKNCQQPQ